MSSSKTDTEAETDTEATNSDPEAVKLSAQVELLTEENERLREEYVRARRSQYRTTAFGLAGIGILAILGGLLFPAAREVLIGLGATGLFGALLTYYLTPTQFVAADVGERVYTATTTNLAGIADELGLHDEQVYVPGEREPAQLYVPQHAEFTIPDSRLGPIVVDEDSRGLLLTPTGTELFREFECGLSGELATSPPVLAEQLTDALVQQFELARSTDVDSDPEHDRVTVAITGSAFGPVDRFDHPIGSFLAVGFATGLDRPITLEVSPDSGQADWLVTCRWGNAERSSD
ncbi:hypothetical protein C482_20241 [Natrialba chahannaoensis JCM 10990]|uniref:DUF7982 domain-containing protein n=1 Tax=Natrialba chahannaoensis JCM 10990 TaxID=1227492 RepID=M0A3Z9_9EURY|nr:hypothetical protein [Natrialba chahannaoensis]ELY93041.1 hypothetical protein C482_20241 [Natrialba chahannaoensis JCM 10990]